MFIIIDQHPMFAAVSYEIDTPAGERRARIALAAAGIEWAHVWLGEPSCPDAFLSRRRLFAVTDDDVTAVYTPSPALLAAATR